MLSSAALAQLPSYTNVSASNQLEYSLEDETNAEIVEDWFQFDYDLSPFEGGFRYELYQPRENPVHTPDIEDASSQGITYRYVRYKSETFNMTLGNFYTLFGRGMTLRTYEDRNIRVDNSLDGLLLETDPWKLRIKALTGRVSSNYPLYFPIIPRVKVDQIHAIDVEADVLENVTVGTSFLSSREGVSPFPRTELAAVRGEASLWLLDFYGEYGEMSGMEEGKGLYFATSFNRPGLGVSAEYKRYRDIAFRTSDFTDYNNPPSLTREHAFALLNRYPHQLDADDEQGYQIEVTWSPDDVTTTLFNTSHTWDRYDETAFREYYGEVERYLGESFRAVVALDWSEELKDSFTKNLTPVVELEYYLDDVNTLRGEYQHQHTKGDTLYYPDGGLFWLGEFDQDYILLEYTRAPRWSISLVHERTSASELQRNIMRTDILSESDRSRWIFATVSCNISESNNITVMYGSRHGGYNCVGGVCRLEPEFKGLEVKLFTRF